MVARNIDMLLGITHQHVSRFNSVGISNTLQLLNAVDSMQAKRTLAQSVATTQRQMTRWLCSADLLRIRGLSTHYANLLIEAGVHTSVDLAEADVDQLIESMHGVNNRRRFVKRLPAASLIAQWQIEAQQLPIVRTAHQTTVGLK